MDRVEHIPRPVVQPELAKFMRISLCKSHTPLSEDNCKPWIEFDPIHYQYLHKTIFYRALQVISDGVLNILG